MRKILLRHHLSVGDCLILSSFVRDLALTYPNDFEISVSTSCNSLFKNNPYVKDILPLSEEYEGYEVIRIGYTTAINNVGRLKQHFCTGFHRHFEELTGIHVPVLYPKPDYHLSEEEKSPLISNRYWLIMAGNKTDFQTKAWNYKSMQALVNVLRGFGLRFVQTGAVLPYNPEKKINHFHPLLENALCLINRTTLRDLGRLVYFADGIINPITCTVHFAAALDKPCVVIGGGREHVEWISYTPGPGKFGNELREDIKVPHRFLHTVSLLDCCNHGGCWRSNVIGTDKHTCKYPLEISGQYVPKCMDMIKTEHIVEAVMSYYKDGTLPPIGEAPRIALVNGKPKLLAYDEPYPAEDQSPIAEALRLPEPCLLQPTEGMRKRA